MEKGPGTVCKLMDITSQSALFVKSESKKKITLFLLTIFVSI